MRFFTLRPKFQVEHPPHNRVVMDSACDPQLPDAGEIWDGVVEQSGERLDQAGAAM